MNRDINKAGLVDIIGENNHKNIQGETQRKLDAFANDKFKAALATREVVASIASEEEDKLVIFENGKSQNGKYVVLMDPLDGSSNIDVNVSVSTIFSIYHRITPLGTPVNKSDFFNLVINKLRPDILFMAHPQC